jgi:hypothetical protein
LAGLDGTLEPPRAQRPARALIRTRNAALHSRAGQGFGDQHVADPASVARDGAQLS